VKEVVGRRKNESRCVGGEFGAGSPKTEALRNQRVGWPEAPLSRCARTALTRAGPMPRGMRMSAVRRRRGSTRRADTSIGFHGGEDYGPSNPASVNGSLSCPMGGMRTARALPQTTATRADAHHARRVAKVSDRRPPRQASDCCAGGTAGSRLLARVDRRRYRAANPGSA
jgi:hypothetical protein